MNRLAITLIALMIALGAPGAFAQEEVAADQEVAPATPEPPPEPKAETMGELLERVKGGWQVERKEDKARVSDFTSRRNEQQRLLTEAKATKAAEERRSEMLETQFEENEGTLATLEDTLRERLGALGELFGVVRQVSGDTRGQIEGSMVSAQIPGREAFLEELGRSKKLPAIASLEKLWFILHQEMTELGKVTKFTAPVIDADGIVSEQTVIRAGAFTVISDGNFLIYEEGQLQVLPRQPAGTYVDTVKSFEAATGGGTARLALDPSRGPILKVLIQTPDAAERIEAGGIVGKLIISLGIMAGVLAIWRWIVVSITGRKVASQKKSDKALSTNPLGRVISVYEENRNADVETLELKLDEIIMRESSSLEKFLWVVKVVSVVAPLMGLLGTVTGMIKTFQMITLFGTGDPKMMASGISEALVTTMLGLCVAIPMVLLHASVANTAKGVIQVLEEQATGLIARRAENTDGAA
jgi:biopolymer transport protein ExbB